MDIKNDNTQSTDVAIANMPPITQPKFTAELKKTFCETLAATGIIKSACMMVGISRETYRRHYDADKVFAEACEEAMAERAAFIENTIVKRALEGTEELLIGGKNKDRIVARQQRFSDALQLTVLKRYVPEYKDKTQVDLNVNIQGVIAIPQFSMTYEQWYEMAMKIQAPAEEAQMMKDITPNATK